MGLKLQFGIDLERAAILELDFLKTVELFAHDDQLIAPALRRYEQLWLPLVAEHGNEVMAAPLDVEFAWYCHMLSPVAYEQDCQSLFGVTINHKLISADERSSSLIQSLIRWNAKYPQETFHPNPSSDVHSAAVASQDLEFKSRISYDLTAAWSRQRSFYYQVSLPHFRDAMFLSHAKGRYQKFLLLRTENPDAFLVPSYDIDLIWHAHQAHPLEYKDDTVRHIGCLFNHDDTTTDRSPGSKLSTADQNTRQLWKDTFNNENPVQFGAMYRGESSVGKLYQLLPEDAYKLCTKRTEITFKSVFINGIEAAGDGKLTVKFVYMTGRSEGKTMLKLRGKTDYQDLDRKGSFTFDTHKHNSINCVCYRSTGLACLSTHLVLCENAYIRG
jgi:hypothetical protein